MRYSIIDKALGETNGLNPMLHRLAGNGKKMVVNENELRHVNADIDTAATQLGGKVLTEGELRNELKKLNNE